MKSAPALQLVWRPPRKTSAALAALVGLAAGVAALTASQHLLALMADWEGSGWLFEPQASRSGLVGVVAGLAVGLSAAALAWRRAIAAAAMIVHWDGRQWLAGEAAEGAASPTRPVRVACATDLGSWLLMSLRAPAGSALPTRWLAFEQGSCGPRWHALRCALYAPTPRPSPDTAPEDITASGVCAR